MVHEMNSFLLIFEQLAAFFLMMLTGYLAARLKIITKSFLDGLSSLVMKILLPVLIFANAMNGTQRSQLIADFPILLMSLVMYLLLIILFGLLARLLRLPKERGQIFQAVFIFGNVGFIGLPLILGISPEQGAIYVALMSIADQGLLWTYGLYLTTPSGENASFSLKNFVNPALGAILLSIILLIPGIHPPAMIENALLTIGRTATPLSLIYLGGLLFFCDWKPVIRQKELYIGIAVKMILFPLAYYAIASRIVPNTDMVNVMTIVAGLPTMATIAMFAQSKKKDGEYALGIVLISTVASLLTLTLVAYLIF